MKKIEMMNRDVGDDNNNSNSNDNDNNNDTNNSDGNKNKTNNENDKRNENNNNKINKGNKNNNTIIVLRVIRKANGRNPRCKNKAVNQVYVAPRRPKAKAIHTDGPKDGHTPL